MLPQGEATLICPCVVKTVNNSDFGLEKEEEKADSADETLLQHPEGQGIPALFKYSTCRLTDRYQIFVTAKQPIN